jgi:hypothetical protein
LIDLPIRAKKASCAPLASSVSSTSLIDTSLISTVDLGSQGHLFARACVLKRANSAVKLSFNREIAIIADYRSGGIAARVASGTDKLNTHANEGVIAGINS